MNRIGLAFALAGFGLACWVVWQQDLQAVGGLLASAGLSGLMLTALSHIPAMVLNAQAWSMLMPRHSRPALPSMVFQIWVREAVNALLPVGRIGGELVCYRLLRRQGMRAAPAAGGLIADVALSLVSQLLFALLGVALLAAGGAALGWGGLLAGLALGAACAGGFILALRWGLIGRAIAVLNGLARNRLASLAEGARRLDTYMRRLWGRPRALLACTAWQFAAWLAGGVEIWVGCQVLGAPISVADALMIEALIQALASAAFIVPGALGVQEAGFVGLAVLAGLDPSTGAALALTRRFRDLVLYLPGLLAWAAAERRPLITAS